jgi:hypothetical protein
MGSRGPRHPGARGGWGVHQPGRHRRPTLILCSALGDERGVFATAPSHRFELALMPEPRHQPHSDSANQ